MTVVSLRALPPAAATRRPAAGEVVSRIAARARPEPGMLEAGCCTTPATALAACEAVPEPERLKGAMAVAGAAAAFRADGVAAAIVPAAAWPTAATACPAALAELLGGARVARSAAATAWLAAPAVALTLWVVPSAALRTGLAALDAPKALPANASNAKPASRKTLRQAVSSLAILAAAVSALPSIAFSAYLFPIERK
jgi:hypothetical protein